ncbi:O-methyltransferase [Coniophora puteana RWD-64-598 SS2]|uniref:O-methyltransferase n=1 Tax=Coniophora puteana (strain RWD-64-598) TaxID=741705 RepID=A0A5M3N2R1_CONPW|nr:O-methyltransferase [Coniophora puteana RWD-64-598 SS2]EIW85658.1 O-methyltransferase [Coniophora puteana RWD-64-598 SS2]
MSSTQADWSRSVQYHNSFLLQTEADKAVDAAIAHSAESGLPDWAVARNEGKFLKLVARSIGAKRILEIGALGGVSTIWMAQALPADGRIVTLELSKRCAEVAQRNYERAGVASKIRIMLGDAVDTLAGLDASEPFDVVFIDADKTNNPTYYNEAKRLIRQGGVIIVDNAIYHGTIADPKYKDSETVGTREMLRLIKEDSEVDATTIGTAGEKGFDGFLYAVKL